MGTVWNSLPGHRVEVGTLGVNVLLQEDCPLLSLINCKSLWGEKKCQKNLRLRFETHTEQCKPSLCSVQCRDAVVNGKSSSVLPC